MLYTFKVVRETLNKWYFTGQIIHCHMPPFPWLRIAPHEAESRYYPSALYHQSDPHGEFVSRPEPEDICTADFCHQLATKKVRLIWTTVIWRHVASVLCSWTAELIQTVESRRLSRFRENVRDANTSNPDARGNSSASVRSAAAPTPGMFRD